MCDTQINSDDCSYDMNWMHTIKKSEYRIENKKKKRVDDSTKNMDCALASCFWRKSYSHQLICWDWMRAQILFKFIMKTAAIARDSLRPLHCASRKQSTKKKTNKQHKTSYSYGYELSSRMSSCSTAHFFKPVWVK